MTVRRKSPPSSNRSLSPPHTNLREVDRLLDLVMLADWNLRVWRFFTKTPAIGSLLETQNHYSEFLRLSRRAHLGEAIICAFQLFADDNNSVNFARVVADLERRKLLPPKSISGYRRRIKSAQADHRRVKYLRNKVFAHTDWRKNADAVFEKAGISPNILLRHVRRALKLIDDMTYELRRDTHAVGLDPAQDLRRLLEDAREIWRRREKEQTALFR